MRRSLVIAVTAVTAVLAAAPGVRADVVPVDPGAVADGRPISGTGQNLPSMGVTATYDAGDGFAAQIRAYYESGQARRDQRDVSRATLRWVRDFVDDRCDGRARSCDAMVVFDIDDTLLDNFAFYSGLDPAFSFDQAAYNAFAESCSETANGPVRTLYRKLKAMRVTLVVMSGRSDSLRAATAQCLRQRGMSGWHRLVLKQPDDTRLASVYKAAERKKLHRAGYRILASVGDQVSDMSGGYLKHGFLLPNPMYFIP
jgi:HAD superfamily, subfamily IIIB (Acid phosphatase)